MNDFIIKRFIDRVNVTLENLGIGGHIESSNSRTKSGANGWGMLLSFTYKEGDEAQEISSGVLEVINKVATMTLDARGKISPMDSTQVIIKVVE
jgi:hypothetical protein